MDEIGHAIAGDPVEQQANVFKDFLTKPENLVTALVLAAGLTSRRSPGQSRVNQALTAGVGALGFRGGLEKGVQDTRAKRRKEEGEAAQGAADIAQGKERNKIAADTNTIRREAITTPRPQTESQIASDQALAALRRAQAGNVGAPDPLAPVPTSFTELFQKNIALAREFLLPGKEIDLSLISEQTLQEQKRLQLGEMGALRFEKGVEGIEHTLVPPDRRKDFPEFFNSDGTPKIPTPPPDKDTEKPRAPGVSAPTTDELLKITGGFGNRSVGTGNLVSKLRKARPEFEGQDDQTIAATLADIVDEVRAGSFDNASAEDVQAILDQFGPGLPAKDKRKLLSLVRQKTLRSKFAKIKIGR